MTSMHLPMRLFGKVVCPGGVGGFEHLYIPGFLDRALQTRQWRPPKFLNHSRHPTNLSMYSTQPTSNWSVDDDVLLIENGHLEKISACRWILGNGMLCNELVKGKDFSGHLRGRHGVVEAPSLQHRCRWEGCQQQQFNRDCLIRHVREQHLLWRWPCPYCHQLFTRKSTMLDHRDNLCPYRRV
ncbi:hypothetical protein F5J12DRAFT_443684 [Pisolithus orientalis]|uniref:uncharacterized protein n=1 Tax=Pisolithus orientalis TaxID=936130 RepID=UPI0022253472|nr:uncharacterized protein F5J12DRAFT_443684 [Pisolithus orientalis]KAI6025664.1 hypothetical protein F5J12DRAFT_443684 [Pisolithus orientalis]